jgi:DNA polymerase-3 subunit alpha
MGFVTLEDIQGNIELVLFPRTWEKTRERLTVGQIIIVEGKADTGSTPPKILVDEIRTEITILEPLDASTMLNTGVSPAPKPEVDSLIPETHQSAQNDSHQKKIPPKPGIPPSIRKTAERPAAYLDQNIPTSGGDWDNEWDGMPPPPDNFPEDWDSEWQPSFENAEIAARPESKNNNGHVSTVSATIPPALNTEVGTIEPTKVDQIEVPRESLAVQPVEPGLPAQSAQLPPSLYGAFVKEESDKEHPPQQITVMLRSTGDKDRDKRRIKTIYGTLISFHGRDRFSFHIFENGKGHLIDFPNDTTRICLGMLERLKKLMGEESWRVEEITFQ